jgi:hypothetical protein
LRPTPWGSGGGDGGGGGAVLVGGDHLGDLALIEALTQALRAFRARSRGAHRVSERHRGAKPRSAACAECE